MLCEVFSLCYGQFAVTKLVVSLRACFVSLSREGPDKGPREGPLLGQRVEANKGSLSLSIYMRMRHELLWTIGPGENQKNGPGGP